MPKVILNRTTDITRFCGNLSITDNLDSITVELSFTTVKNPQDRYITSSRPVIVPGDKVDVIGDTRTLFSGIITEVSLAGEYKALDYGFYLSNNDVIIQFNKTSCSTAVQQLCAKAGIPLGSIPGLPGTMDGLYIENSVLEILQDIIETATAAAGKNYFMRVRDGALNIYEYPQTLTFAKHRFEAGNELDVTYALGSVDGSDSITDMRNNIVVVSEDNGEAKVLAEAINGAAAAKFGKLTKTVKKSSDEENPAEKAANTLKELGNIKTTRSVGDMLGSEAVTAGILLLFSSDKYDLTGAYLVKSVTHTFGAAHRMSLDLENAEAV